MELDKEEHACLKAIYEEDDNEVTNLSYKQVFKLSVKDSKENEKLEENIVDIKDHSEFLESSNKRLGI